MNLVQTILIFVVAPTAIYVLIGLVTMRSKFVGTPRYRPGQEWTHPPVWWTANPVSLTPRADAGSEPVGGQLGGARGSW